LNVKSTLQSLFSILLSRKLSTVKIPFTIANKVHFNFKGLIVSKYSPQMMNKDFISTARRIIDKLHSIWTGNKTFFSAMEISLEGLSFFAKKVLYLTMKIPRGFVTTYGDIAELLGGKKYSRAVAKVLSENPVPLAVPCHRVVYFDGQLGGYSAEGGVRVKRQLLEKEGVRFTSSGKVCPKYIVRLDNLSL
jgi:methylated-DNA-[protein]-cysteine S-methyltransferase